MIKWLMFPLLIGATHFEKLQAAPLFSNHQKMVDAANLTPYYSDDYTNRKKIKIAVLDNGFRGYKNEIGGSLPQDTHADYAEGPLAPPDPQEVHGLVMAQIIVQLMTNGGSKPSLAPELYLFNSYGFTNFKNAIDQAITAKVDLILYSQVWDYGGNLDGRGFINSEVNRALNNGILWINAAGDFGNSTYNTGIKTLQDDWIQLPDSNNALKVECRPKESEKSCHLRAVAAWNDFKDEAEIGTIHDLDFYLFDDTLNIISSSALKQTEKIPDGQAGYSLYPREIIQTDIPEGTYFLRLKNRSKNFSRRDAVRITVSGKSLGLPSADKEESLPVPADNPGAITVAGTELSENSRSVYLKKPDLIAFSTVELPDSLNRENSGFEKTARGSSTAAALVVGSLGLFKSVYPDLVDRQKILEKVKNSGGSGSPGKGIPLRDLYFGPTQNKKCFTSVEPQRLPPYLLYLFQNGGIPVFTTAGVKIFFQFDPMTLAPQFHRVVSNDMLMMTPQGFTLYPRTAMHTLPPDFYEAVQTPLGQRICRGSDSEMPTDGDPRNYQNPNFWLP